MANQKNIKYTVGFYGKKRLTPDEWINKYIHKWEKERVEIKRKKPEVFPCISFSRKVAVGTLEVADNLSKKTGLQVVDRGILEYIAAKSKIAEKTIAYFDERYPGKRNEFISMIFGEKSFIQSDYSKMLFSAVYSFANLESTIFVGRGTHLILPREKVLAVRIINSTENRVNNLAGFLKINVKDAAIRLKELDKEQKKYFSQVFKKKEAPPYEFDLVINRDYFTKADDVADIVYQAFKSKFDERKSE